jgi:hypothetical protein
LCNDFVRDISPSKIKLEFCAGEASLAKLLLARAKIA